MQWTRLATLLTLAAANPAIAQDSASSCLEPDRNRWAQQVELKNIDNFNLYRVTPAFYRSAQPNKEAFAALANQVGIRTVVSLRVFYSDKPFTQGLPLRLATPIPMHTWHIEWEDVVKALKEVRRASPQAPVLVHCRRGADRTGLITALYRVLYEGWCKDAAIDEMMKGNFGFHPMWGDIPNFIQAVDVERLRRAIDQP